MFETEEFSHTFSVLVMKQYGSVKHFFVLFASFAVACGKPLRVYVKKLTLAKSFSLN
jgi:hypothetical protein